MTNSLEKDIRKAIKNSKEELFMGLCHDLKAPLQTMLGFNAMNLDKLNQIIEPAIDHTDDRSNRTMQQLYRNINIIEEEGIRLTSMIDNLLDMYCLEQEEVYYNLVPCRVSDLLSQTAEMMESACASKGLEWTLVMEDSLPLILVDRQWINRVLENLLSNAVKFTETGSIKCTVTGSADKVKFVIEDTGVGIPQEYQHKIFAKFVKVQGAGNQKGIGLGLAIARNIVEKHGGHIWLESYLERVADFALPFRSVNRKIFKCKGGTGCFRQCW